jgi:hypothetical protein
MTTKPALRVAVLWLALAPALSRAQPFTPQLVTDPDIGNLLGVQRFGRPLRSDPDQGDGFSYRVFPVAYGPSTPILTNAAPVPLPLAAVPAAAAVLPVPPAPPRAGLLPQPVLVRPLTAAQAAVADVEKRLVVNPPHAPGTPYDSTHGVRNYALPPPMAAAVATLGVRPDPKDQPLDHEPLIQIKVRVVDVERAHELDVASVLDYISRNPATAPPSFITGNNLNGNAQNTTAASRFSIPGVLSVAGTALSTGTQGFVLNLTTEHINYILSALQTQFHGDLITAPEVTTINNQNVEFFSGSKEPFVIGQNVTTGETNNIQQFFYKHIGAYISVTPRLVNWDPAHGHHGEGLPGQPVDPGACDACKRWHANDCTIDLTIVVRISDTGTANVTVNGQANTLNFEDNVRAITNVVQVKSGEGVVMAGLIGEQDQRSESKIPFLGDIPVVGFLFRSKTTARQKTETLIFVEARVLDPDPCLAREQTYEDFLLGQAYVDGPFLANPLEEAMQRTGFGPYLPPLCPAEERYWERFGRKIRTVATKLDDITE